MKRKQTQIRHQIRVSQIKIYRSSVHAAVFKEFKIFQKRIYEFFTVKNAKMALNFKLSLTGCLFCGDFDEKANRLLVPEDRITFLLHLRRS